MVMARLVTGAGLVAALVAPAARADIMHWYWEVEVNGEAVDASRPIGVGPGDEVLIDLWASWSPQGDGFAWSWLSLSAGDQFFASASSVNHSEADDLGRNPSLSFDPGRNGEFVDTDNSGENDTIDWIDVYQLPRIYGLFDDSHPIRVYSLRLSLDRTLEIPVTVARTDVFANGHERFQHVWLDEWGDSAEYAHHEDVLRFVSSAPVMLPLLSSLVLARRTKS